jgi:hypothetical protein
MNVAIVVTISNAERDQHNGLAASVSSNRQMIRVGKSGHGLKH